MKSEDRYLLLVNAVVLLIMVSIGIAIWLGCKEKQSEREEEERIEVEYGTRHPSRYRIIYINGDVDTIEVWSSAINEDDIWMGQERGLLSCGDVFLTYRPYSDKEKRGLESQYNVLRYEKIED